MGIAISKALIVMSATTLSLWLAASCLDYASALKHSYNLNNRDGQQTVAPLARIADQYASYWNALVSPREQRITALDREINSLERTLEFMVWPLERSKILDKLKDLLRQKINLQPNSGRDYLSYLSISESIENSNSEKLWLLQRAIKIKAWQVESRFTLVHYCIRFEEILSTELESKCIELFVHVADLHKPRRIAQLSGISRGKLMDSFREAGVPLE